MVELTKEMIAHLKEHQTYPASKADLVKACNNLMDFSEEQKNWFTSTLPDGTYANADEVVKALS